jgi:hypothetical protein
VELWDFARGGNKEGHNDIERKLFVEREECGRGSVKKI